MKKTNPLTVRVDCPHTITVTRNGFRVDTANGVSTHGNASAAAEMAADLIVLDLDVNAALYRYLRSLLDAGCELISIDRVDATTFDVHSNRNGVLFETYTITKSGTGVQLRGVQELISNQPTRRTP